MRGFEDKKNPFTDWKREHLEALYAILFLYLRHVYHDETSQTEEESINSFIDSLMEKKDD